MKRITAKATVDEGGVLSVRVPVDIEPGEYQVAVFVHEQAQNEDADAWPPQLVALDWSA